MAAYELFWGITWYDILMFLGMMLALAVFSIYTTKKKMSANSQFFLMLLAIAAMIGGIYSAFFFQAIWNFIATGNFVFEGMTFLGGLIGGAVIFLLGYYLLGKRFLKERYKKDLSSVVNVAGCCVAIAHMFGRFGCFTAGCCYGKETSGPFGMHFAHLEGYRDTTGIYVYPTQLYEALFLGVLFTILTIVYFKKEHYTMPIYLLAYGLFRFLIEFLRGDYRGSFFIPGLSPSQGISLLMMIGGLIWIGLLLRYCSKKTRTHPPESETTSTDQADDT